MLSLIFLIIAAILNAVMDSLEEGRFQNSIFKNLNPKFWYKYESWKYARRIFRYPIDAWHLAKSAMCGFIILAIANVIETFPILLTSLILGITWIVIFNLFYNKILRKKPNK